jgi:hypothetical protein
VSVDHTVLLIKVFVFNQYNDDGKNYLSLSDSCLLTVSLLAVINE